MPSLMPAIVKGRQHAREEHGMELRFQSGRQVWVNMQTGEEFSNRAWRTAVDAIRDLCPETAAMVEAAEGR